MELSPAQKLAVEIVGKNVCVSAGPGSGKTRVLVERFLHLVKQYRISPSEILAITFTEKAAHEMKRRIVERLREEGREEARRAVENAVIGTLHAFSARILREHPVEAGVDPHFVIFKAEEAALHQERALDETIERLSSDPVVFDLLKRYGERSIRQGILEAYQRSRHSEASFEKLLRKRSGGDRPSFEAEIQKELGGEIGGDEEALLALRTQLRASGKDKERIQLLKERILDFAAFLREEKSLSWKEVFIQAALEFEKSYEAVKRNKRALDFDDLQQGAVRLLGSEAAGSKALRKLYQEKFREILVDEFQDTDCLQDRLVELIRRESNLFIVGDLKQSIYGFRGTQVELFTKKENEFGSSPLGTRIALVENYRSRPRLIDFVNTFFEKLWKEDPLPFDPLRAIRDESGEKPRVERLALDSRKDETIEALRIREARSLARRIRSLVEEEGFRYRDLALLFEAMTQVHFYEQEFRRADIPYFVVSNRGFYSQPEIRDIVNFLMVLENPRRDVQLAALLRSPLFQVADETLFWLARRAKEKRGETPLAEAVRIFETLPEIEESEKARLRFFQGTLEALLQEKERLQVSELVEKILRITDYDLYVLKWRPAERRYANLRKLVEIAREMESKEPLLLGDFIRAVKGLQTREVRESQAQVEAEEGNGVKLMTIHLAKGLEFPVVILPDLGRSDRAEGGEFLFTEEEGLGMKVPKEEGFGLEETLTYRNNKKRLQRLRSEESKRLLYVAMTRAKERLLLSGPKYEADSSASFHDMATWAHWVEAILQEGNWEVQPFEEAPPEPFPFERRKALAELRPIRTRLAALDPLRIRDPEELERVDQILEALKPLEPVSYERIDLPVSAFLLFAKDPEAYFRVYELGAPPREGEGIFLEIKEEGISPDRDEEEGGERLTPRAFGTRVHQILEQILIRRIEAGDAERFVSRWASDLAREERKEIFEIVRSFFQSDTAREVLDSKAFYPELPFVFRLPRGLVHGTMDLVYESRKGEWVILDYKTSEADEKSLRERGEAYRIQLELYALALWKILGRPPGEAKVHFLRPSLTHVFSFGPEDLEPLFEKFTALQDEILGFRKARLSGGVIGISLDKS